MIDHSGIKDSTIIAVLKEVLIVDATKRPTMKEVMNSCFFEFGQKSMVKLSSVFPINHSYDLSKFEKSKFIEAGKYTINMSGHNPYKEELFKRDFKESIIIADLFERVKNWIYDNFEVQ